MKHFLLCLMYGMSFAALANMVGLKDFWGMEILLVFSVLFAVLYAYLND